MLFVTCYKLFLTQNSCFVRLAELNLPTDLNFLVFWFRQKSIALARVAAFRRKELRATIKFNFPKQVCEHWLKHSPTRFQLKTEMFVFRQVFSVLSCAATFFCLPDFFVLLSCGR